MLKTRWETIRDDVAGMLADGVPLEDITGKLEKLKNEYQKPMTNEEYIRSCSTEELAKLIYKIAVTDVLMDRFFTAEIVNAEIVDVDSGIKEAELWLKEKHHE